MSCLTNLYELCKYIIQIIKEKIYWTILLFYIYLMYSSFSLFLFSYQFMTIVFLPSSNYIKFQKNKLSFPLFPFISQI